ncbi:MAG: hypothetical protein WBD28_08660 [Candidatus Zixiibacteriota bacterium]
MDISQIISMLPSLYQIIKEFVAKKGESEATKKLEEYQGEILEKLEKVVEESKNKIDQQINIVAKGDVNLQQNYYGSPKYYITLGNYAVATASASGSFLIGEQGAQLNFPDPKGYLAMMYKLNRVADALEKQTEAISKPRFKIESRGKWSDGGCDILFDNRGEEPITLKKIVFKWEYIGHEGDWYDFSKDYNKKFFKGDSDIIKFEVPKHFIEEKAPKEIHEDQIKRIFFLINTEIEVQYEDSSENKYIETIRIGKFL